MKSVAAAKTLQISMKELLGDDAARVTLKSWRQFGVTLVGHAVFSTTDQVAFGNRMERLEV